MEKILTFLKTALMMAPPKNFLRLIIAVQKVETRCRASAKAILMHPQLQYLAVNYLGIQSLIPSEFVRDIAPGMCPLMFALLPLETQIVLLMSEDRKFVFTKKFCVSEPPSPISWTTFQKHVTTHSLPN